MKRSRMIVAATLAVFAVQAGVREDFANPPHATRLQMWYHWVGDCVTREGLTRDFKAFGDLGVGLVHIISPNMAKLPRTAETMSPEWLDLFGFAIGEAKKNGLLLSFHNCPGWSSSGGPWITPENAMKVVVSSEMDVDLANVSNPPSLPAACAGNRGFYRDIAVFAIPLAEPVFRAQTKPSIMPIKKEGTSCAAVYESPAPLKPKQVVVKFREASFHADCIVEASADGSAWVRIGEAAFRCFRAPTTPKIIRLKDVPDGARFFRLTMKHAPTLPWVPPCDLNLLSVEFNSIPMISGVERFNSSTSDYGYHPELSSLGCGIAADSVVDLTPTLSSDGTPDLSNLSNAFRIVRIGYTCKEVGPAPATIRGLECDKLDRRGIDAHWAGMPAKILALPGAKGTVVETYIDSYEVGGQNWSENLAPEFKNRRGYPIGKALLTVCGYLLDDGSAAAKFLWDFQRTIGELFAENYYDRFAELCRANGIRAVAQTYGGPFDVMRAARNLDEPQGEYWMGGNECGSSSRLMASVAHLYGKPIVSAESFTSEEREGRWLASPHWFRTIGDRYGWLNGINRIVCHSYCHQPFVNVTPGISLGRHGSHFNVNSTWWRDGRGWHDYVRRGQALLQYGRPRADILVADGQNQNDLLHAGFDYDLCGEYDVGSLVAHPGGGVGLPGGPAYQMLVVAPVIARRADASLRAKLKALADAGVKVAYGSAAVAVREAKLRPPFESPEKALCAIRREGNGGETIWYVVNTAKKPFAGEVTFLAQAGTRPSIFDAKTGKIGATEFREIESGRVAVRLDLMPEASAFVVFEKKANTSSAAPSASAPQPLNLPTLSWTITSFEGLNPPDAPLVLEKLVDWSKSSDPKLKYFAGRAVYETTLALAATNRTLILDLGEVHEIANVWVNDKFVGCLWEPPYRVELPRQSVAQPLRLRIEVVNLLPNRLIGDAIAIKSGAKEEMSPKGPWPKWVLEGRRDSGTGIFTWSNFRGGWKADDPLLPSGLLGPVKFSVVE